MVLCLKVQNRNLKFMLLFRLYFLIEMGERDSDLNYILLFHCVQCKLEIVGLKKVNSFFFSFFFSFLFFSLSTTVFSFCEDFVCPSV